MSPPTPPTSIRAVGQTNQRPEPTLESMVVHRRDLPIADPCTALPTESGEGFCNRCQKYVHDLSAMTERAALRMLATATPGGLCVSYRVGPNGAIRFRPEPRPRAVGVLALGLVACAEHHRLELETPDEDCPNEVCVDDDWPVVLPYVDEEPPPPAGDAEHDGARESAVLEPEPPEPLEANEPPSMEPSEIESMTHPVNPTQIHHRPMTGGMGPPSPKLKRRLRRYGGA